MRVAGLALLGAMFIFFAYRAIVGFRDGFIRRDIAIPWSPAGKDLRRATGSRAVRYGIYLTLAPGLVAAMLGRVLLFMPIGDC